MSKVTKTARNGEGYKLAGSLFGTGIKSSCRKFIVSAVVGVCALIAHSATIEISSGDVTALTNAIKNYTTSSHTIKLAAGDYDLTGIQMEDEGSEFGKTHLVVRGVKIIGQGERPEDTRLIGDGTCRIYRMIKDTYARLENLTITNGYAKTIEGAANSKHGGGIYGYPTVTNCVIIGNKADGNGGGACGYTYIWVCRILNNTAGENGGGVYQPNYVNNSLVRGNAATKNGGGIHGNSYGSARGSTITENTAGVSGGGIAYVNTVTNCFISLNTSASSGSAIYSGGRSNKFAYDCTICSNKNTGASGSAYEYQLFGGKVFANYAKSNGGGAAYCNLTGVEVHDNYAAAYGGGVYGCNATNCVLRNNFFGNNDGANAFGSVLYGCEVIGTGVNSGRAINSDFHDIASGTAIQGNPYISDKTWSGHIYSGIPVCTNCIFRNNYVTNYSQAVFCGVSAATRSGWIVNCTIVSNKYGKTLNYMSTAAYPVYIRNCVFVWNRAHDSDTIRDLHSWENLSTSGMRFANCAYGVASGRFVAGGDYDLANCSDGPMYKFGTNGFGSDPKFVLGDAQHPYEPKLGSPLRGRGLVEDWMSAATDIRGEGFPRLRDGKADIGCYQCWLVPVGFVISLH